MGYGLSKRRKEKDLLLNNSGLAFNSSQLSFLNYHFSDQLSNTSGDLKCDPKMNTTTLVERLMQRLLCGVGTLDSRFSSKFLINLDPTKNSSKGGRESFSYLVRLDGLSSPQLYPEHQDQPTCNVVLSEGGPQGFAKVRPTGCRVEEWAEFINQHGFLRRDKLQERFVELLAQSAARSSVPGSPAQIDESKLCGCPGKVVDPGMAFHLTQIPPEEQFYFGAAECHRHSFPDPREFRLAIVEGTPCVRLRVGLLPSLCFSTLEEDIQVTLTLGIGFTGWPQSCDFPRRVSLSHIDILLYHEAATTGFYLVPAPPHPTTRCDDRSATWQFRFPAAECTLLSHYATHSTPARVLAVLRMILADLRRTTNGGQVISDYMLKTFLWFRLEEDCESLIPTLKKWDHNQLSTHVLTILDQLVAGLRTQRHRSYWFPWFNVMLSSPGGGTLHYTEEDYCHDAELVISLLCRLYEHSSQPLPPSLHSLEAWQSLDSCLVGKWQDVLGALTPPATNRTRRMRLAPRSASQYSARQLEYVRHVLRGMLTVRALTLYQDHHFPNFLQNSEYSTNPQSTESSEDLIYLLTSIIEQAKSINSSKKRKETKTKRIVKSYTHTFPKRESTRSGKKTDNYEAAVSSLMGEVRKDTSDVDLSVDCVLVKEVLKWLYYGMDTDHRHLSPILRPYLNCLFAVSHENCWHIEEWKKRQENEELFALGKFAKLVVQDGLSPRDGISDAIRKGWQWAEHVVETASQFSEGVELLFTPSPGRVVRYQVRVHQESTFTTRSLGRNSSISKSEARLKFSTLPRHSEGLKDLLKAKLYHEDISDSVHCRLCTGNPITSAINAQRRYGTHRGVGSIVEALVTLNKFSVLQEVSNLLPEDERAQVLDDIQRVSKERRRSRKPHCREPPPQLYRPVPESGSTCLPVEGTGSSSEEWLTASPTTKSLLGTCREARERQGRIPVYNAGFFESSLPANPMGQPLLRLTSDNSLTLSTVETHQQNPLMRGNHKKEMVTKL